MPRLFAQSLYRGSDTAVSVDMVILKHCRIGEVIAVIAAASCRNGVFLQCAKPRQCLACVGYRSVCAFDQLHAFAGIGRDTAHMLQNIERGALRL